MSSFDSNNQAGGDQSAEAGSATAAVTGQCDPALASFNTIPDPNYVLPVPLTDAQARAEQASTSIPPTVQCAPVAGQCNPETASATGE